MDDVCFKRDLMGDEIVDLKRNPINNEALLTLHRRVNDLLCVSGFLLNLTLTVIIFKCPSNMQKIRPVLLFGVTVDILICLLNFISGPMLIASHGRWLGIINGSFVIDSWITNAILIGLVGWVTVSGWICLPCQFFYRYYLLKYGDRPRGQALFIFGIIVIIILLLSMILAFVVFVTPNTKQFNANSMKITEHYGYFVTSNQIIGSSINDLRMKAWALNSIVLTFGAYAVIIYFALAIKKFLSNMTMSSKSKRLNSDMNKVLLVLSLTPIFTSFLPSIYGSYAIVTCEKLLIPNILISWVLIIAPVINSCMTIYFIQPYRRFFLHIILFTPYEQSTKANISLSSHHLKNQVQPIPLTIDSWNI